MMQARNTSFIGEQNYFKKKKKNYNSNASAKSKKKKKKKINYKFT